ncbi:GntR family transcriptional regulator [Gordoniibacillus kamchatkensis]|uniref:GntR family transcriptional regulator n=1 Tax=Gordoniibacillus kamchatkensis TaxID=1590651 RepID=A0ABR5AK15_9BACL|nr:GntR family transcriptional regulator [Paenibacillus sp. VKM B-2647]KIL41371.1 GntR family transcriptional regulator [Paenibacillus sp. VKM B-2647]
MSAHDRSPLYIQIQNYFKDLILSGRLAENDKIPAEKELLEQFNVSRITIANALAELARDGWIYRIPGRGSFVKGIPAAYDAPKPNAPNTVSTENKAGAAPKIGLVIPQISDYFAIRLMKGISEVLRESKYHVAVMLTFNSKQRETEAIRELKHQAEGLIIFPADAEVYNEEIIALKMENYPFVLVDRNLPGLETNVVRSDGAKGAMLAVDHLWSLGHRNIAVCTDSPQPTASVEERINGYMEALKIKGAMINPALLLNDFDVGAGKIGSGHPLYRFVKSRMASAYITLNSNLGGRIWSIANDLGLRVPEDVSIVTFDDPSPGLEGLSFFTHLDQSEFDMGFKAARLLLDMLANPHSARKYSNIVLEPKLVVGKTSVPQQLQQG